MRHRVHSSGAVSLARGDADGEQYVSPGIVPTRSRGPAADWPVVGIPGVRCMAIASIGSQDFARFGREYHQRPNLAAGAGNRSVPGLPVGEVEESRSIQHVARDSYETITLDLPRKFIGAEKQDGKDDTFIILIDGIEVAYQETVVQSDSRVISINFEQGDSDIEIIGTYVIPEFGTIVMMILIVGITMTIIVARNNFRLIPRS